MFSLVFNQLAHVPVYQSLKVRPKRNPEGIAERNPITEDFKQQILKHLPTMRMFKLDAAADYLEAWVSGTMNLEPLLEVAACLSSTSRWHVAFFVYGWMTPLKS